LCGECGPVACHAVRQRPCNRDAHAACLRHLTSPFISYQSASFIADRLALLPIDQLT
jgi:hypothetical protein